MITKIKIKMGKKEYEMTMDEAQKLHKDLESLFGTKEVVVYRDNNWYWHYPRPYYRDNMVYCSSSGSTGSANSGNLLCADATTDETLTLTC